ncbi:ABC transporter permease [Lysobacter solisilvae (ex Woo and Kim 2020)]|uniref:ABC transporter permease n=1 Tax=Agrilutibacter terrestris TaxID=2865112 RepID=A0A7H0G018_9GAMM|nr:FtsX-like permease family protein [Lysobacter terrestris]QNP41634.1 ABC transporter permease [Lysobacter terrestris]
MELRPILSTLRRHKTAAALIVLEIALSCAIICNAVFLIRERIARIEMPSGVAEREAVIVNLTGIGTNQNAAALTREDLAALRSIPGVSAAASTNEVPFGNSSWNSGVTLAPEQTESTLNATTYLDSGELIQALGVKLAAGRGFNADEYVDYDPDKGFEEAGTGVAIISREVATKLYPGKSAVGQVFYLGDDKPITVVGVVDTLLRPYFGPKEMLPGHSIVLPVRMPYDVGGYYVLRTTPDQRERVLKDAVKVLEKNSPNRIILEQKSQEQYRNEFFQQDRSMVWLLIAVCIALLVVTALGIVGLASFWVQQRTKQIGVRRALGATRGQILRYFQTENFLLATLGIVIGMIGAYGINQLLMSAYELPRLPALYLPIGALVLWGLGQVSVFGPARRAASVPPAVATRSV